MSSSNSNTSLLKSIFNHVALPRKTPGSHDNNLGQIEDSLMDRLIATTKELTAYQLGPQSDNLLAC